MLRYRTVGGVDVLQEPFGLVLVKAMMCGTPMAAMRLGAVTEIVDEDVTGCTTGNSAEFCQTVLRAMALDRAQVRQTAIAPFSADRRFGNVWSFTPV